MVPEKFIKFFEFLLLFFVVFFMAMNDITVIPSRTGYYCMILFNGVKLSFVFSTSIKKEIKKDIQT